MIIKLKIKKENLDKIKSGVKRYEFRKGERIRRQLSPFGLNKELKKPLTLQLENGYSAGAEKYLVPVVAIWTQDNEGVPLLDSEGKVIYAFELYNNNVITNQREATTWLEAEPAGLQTLLLGTS